MTRKNCERHAASGKAQGAGLRGQWQVLQVLQVVQVMQVLQVSYNEAFGHTNAER